jgi:type IV pilus assembly protein PilF
MLFLVSCTTIVEDSSRKADPEAAARDRVALAAEYLKKGDSEKALAHLRLALKANPDSAEAYNLMGVVLEREGAFKKADKAFRKAVRLRDGYAQAQNNYGGFLFRQQRYKDAMKQFQAASEDMSYPNRSLAFEGLGRCAYMLGKQDVAAQALARALKLEPNLPLATLLSGELQFQQKNYEAAYSLYKRYLQLTSDAPQTAQSLWLGIRLERRFGGRDALASYELALKRLYPDSSEYKQYQEALRAEK